MATTNVPTGSALANKLFAAKLMEEAITETYVNKFVGDGNILYRKDELSSKAGDQITYQLGYVPSGVGRTEGETLEGNEEALNMFTDTLVINQLRFGMRSPSKQSIEQKRVQFDFREHMYSLTKKWLATRVDSWFFNQLAGNTATSFTVEGTTYAGADRTKVLGFNTATAPSTNRVIRAGGAATDQALTSADVFTLNIVDACLERAMVPINGPIIQPVKVGGQDKYVMFISPEQYTDLKRDTTSAIQWFDIQTSAMQGGKIDSNPIYTNAIGEYAGVIFHKSTRLPAGVNSSTSATVANTKRAIFCGAGAGCVAFGNAGKGYEGSLSWAEETFDYGDRMGIAVNLIGGLSKSVFNSEDYAVITVPTYAASHTS